MVDFSKVPPSKNVVDKRKQTSRGTFKGDKGGPSRVDLEAFEDLLKSIRKEQTDQFNQEMSRKLTDFARKKSNRLKTDRKKK